MNYRYILIDDEKFTRLGTLEKLSPISDLAQCVGQADDGEAGLALARELQPDVIITDMKMPVMDGTSLLPILAKEFPDTPLIVISGYRDFEYSRQAVRAGAIDYILKPFSSGDIISAMKQAIGRIEDQTALKNRLHSSEEYTETLHLNHDKEQLTNLICGYSKNKLQLTSNKLKFISQSPTSVFVLLHSCHKLSEAEINLLLTDQGYDNMVLYLPHPHTENLGFLLIFLNNPFLSAESVCSRVIGNLRTYFLSKSQQLLYGISGTHESLNELRSAFQESVQALNQKTGSSYQDTYTYGTQSPVPKSIYWDDTDRLLFYMESGKTEDVTAMVTSLFDYYRSLKNATLYEIKYSCIQITNQAKMILNRYIQQIQADSVDSSIRNILDTMFSLEEISSYYHQFFLTLARSLEANNIYSDNDIVNNVKTYIDHNYSKNITTEFVASLFHMNRSYLSHIFKKKQGMAFIDYLSLVRITEAKKLLKSSDTKLYQIAKTVGYDNVSYFCRVFKKLEKKTPETFREEL